MVQSALFSATWMTDAYVIAFRLPNMLRDLFAEGALSSAFVPTFSETLIKQGKSRAFHLANLVFTGVLLVTSAISLLGILFAQPITAAVAAAFSHGVELAGTAQPEAEAKLRLASQLTRMMMPLLALVSVTAVFMGMLNAQRRFSVPALAPALFNMTCLVAGGALWMLKAPPER